MNPVWKLRRLSRMSAREVVHRVLQAAHVHRQRHGIGLAEPREPAGISGKPWTAALPQSIDSAKYVHAADRVLAGRFDVFALRDTVLGFPPNWNRDPKSGTSAPLVFGKTIDYRDERSVGDIKYVWEPSRHLELVTLAQAWHLTREPRYLEGCRTLLDSWISQCPYPRGVHWTSSLEHGVRLSNWAFAWHLLGGEACALFAGGNGQAFRRRWLDCIFQHLHFIVGHFSRFSSANNHLLGEYMGLLIGTLTWPYWRETEHWREMAHAGFEHEALLQNASDGVNLEQAIWYHHEVVDMLLLCGLFARANGCDFGTQYWQRLERMLELIASVMDTGGHVPMIGDADDAAMVRLDPSPEFNVYRSLLASGALVFGRGDFKAKARTLDDKTRWLLGAAAEAQFEALPSAPAPLRRAFPQGGYYILGSDFDTAQEVRIVADAAPLGYLAIAAHGHADALAFTLSARGCELLIDPGTYAYHTQQGWRDYFKGTAAHNTLRVDGRDQSVSGGNFLWMQHANARCREFRSDADEDVWHGSHDGYRRLRDPVTVYRTLHYRRPDRSLRILDRLECGDRHAIEIFWHFHPQCRTRLQGGRLEVSREAVTLELTTPRELQAELVRGREHPPLGWYSPRFDVREPCDTLRVHGTVQGSQSFETGMQVRFLDASAELFQQPGCAARYQGSPS